MPGAFIRIFIVLFASALIQKAPSDSLVLNPAVVQANVFKTGFAMVVRQSDIPAGTHTFRLKTVPQALDNTLWFDVGEGAEISDIRTRLDLHKKETKTPATSIRDYLSQSVGKTVTLSLTEYNYPGGYVHRKLVGKVLAFSSRPGYQQDSLSLILPDGTLKEIANTSIDSIQTKGLSATVTKTEVKPEIVVEFRIRSDHATTFKMGDLEFGAAWNSTYRVSLSGDQASVTAKARIATQDLELKESDINLITGMPDVSRATRLDLTTGFNSLSQWLNSDNSIQQPLRPPLVNPYDLLAIYVAMQAQSAQNGGYGYGGMGGGMGGGGGGFEFKTADSASFAGTNQAENENRLRFVQQAIEAERTEDLFSYPMGSLSLSPGERLTRVLSTSNSSARRHYLWHIGSAPGDANTDPIRSVLTLKNESKAPWPTGTAFIEHGTIPLAEVAMPFTPAGKFADLDMGSTEDIPRSKQTKELGRQEITRPDGTRGVIVTYQTDFTVENTRSELIPLDVKFDVRGVIDKADRGTIVSTGATGELLNPAMEATWQFQLQPGQKEAMTAVYRVIY